MQINKGSIYTRYPNDAYRERFDAIKWDSRHSSTEEHQACTLGVVGSNPAGGSKEHGPTSGAVMSDTMSGLSWDGEIGVSEDNGTSWTWQASNSWGAIDIPHPYEDERL